MEITDKVKLIQMSLLMKSNRPKTSKNEFQSILETVPVDLVRNFSGNIQNICPHQVSSTKVGNGLSYLFNGTLLQNAVHEGKTDFARLLLEFG